MFGEHAADWVPTRFETPSSGRRESLHRDRGLGVDKPPARNAPSEQYGPTNQFGIGFESERVVVASGPGILREDVRVDRLPCKVFQKFGDRPLGALRGFKSSAAVGRGTPVMVSCAVLAEHPLTRADRTPASPERPGHAIGGSH